MIVHLVASAEKIQESIAELRQIVDIIHAQGHSLAVDWIEPAYARSVATAPSRLDWRAIYKENMAAITRSDVIIAESTLRSFGTGYQIAVGVRLKKPTLILRRDDVQNDIMAVGIEEPEIAFKTYNAQTLEETMTAFLRHNDIPTKDLRFNFSIDRRIYNYLRWASLKTGETKAEVIRKLIDHEIDASDQ